MTDEKYLEGVLVEFYWVAFNDYWDYHQGKNDLSAQSKVARAESKRYAKRIAKRFAKKVKAK